MTQVKYGDRVDVHYTGYFEDGTVFDSSIGGDPLKFVVGKGQVIPGFENAVIGMTKGEKKTTIITADYAYGPHHAEMVVEIDRDKFPEHIAPEVGQLLQLQSSDGQTFRITVTNISSSSITLDANHPMAGKDLTFDIEIVKIT